MGTSFERSAGEVGEGTSVGTGMSVGDSTPESYCAELVWTTGRAFGSIVVGASLSVMEEGDGTSVGTGISVGDVTAGPDENRAEPGGRNFAEASISLTSCGDVGEGTSVGTGISVGDVTDADCNVGTGTGRGTS